MKRIGQMNKKERRIAEKKRRLKKTSGNNQHCSNKHLNYKIARMVNRKVKDDSWNKHRKNTMGMLRRKYPGFIK